jgi:hypothetical protein
MVVIKKFTVIDVITRILIGPRSGIEPSGRRIRLIMKIPIGGIQEVSKICVMVKDDFDTYSTHPLQNIVRKRLRMGIIIHPKRGNSENDGKNIARPKLHRVIITLCTIPNVIRRA